MMGEQRFSVIPIRAVTDKSMPAPVFRTLSALGLFADKNGWCYPSLRTLSEVLGVSRSAISRHIKWLAEHGYLNVVPQYNADGSRRTNLIQVRFDYPPEGTVEATPEPETGDEAPEPSAKEPSKANRDGHPEPPEDVPVSEEEPPDVEPVREGVFRPVQQGVSPSATGGVSPSATGGVSPSETGVALKGATGVALKGATLTPQLTPQLTQRVKTTTATTTATTATTTATHARAPAAAADDVAADVAADLPDEIKRALKALGWVGSVAEIGRAWAENPARVRAWLDYARRKGWSAALLRHTLRTDPGLPPEPDAAERARWLAEREALARYQADGGGNGSEPPPEATVSAPKKAGGAAPVPVSTPQEPPDMAATPPTATTNPDMGVAGAGNGASAAREHPPPALPPDVQRWWNAAVGQLQTDDGMPKAAFDTWVRPASPVAWQDENGGAVLTVAVANDYARRWLEERVATILARKLTGFAGRPVTLNIVVE